MAKRITLEAIQSPAQHQILHNAIDTEVDALRTVANELRTDHATSKTQADVVETLIEELHDDHATFKTALDATETLIEELHDDHAIGITWDTEVDGDLDDINDYIHALNEPDGVIGGDFTIAGQAAVTLLGAGRVRYRIGGIEYDASIAGNITLEDSGDIVQNKYGAWSVLIDKLGAVTTEDTGAQMAFTAAEDALLNLSSRADSANKVCIGYFTVMDSGAGGFDIGTTNTTGGTATEVAYMNRMPVKRGTGLTAALGAATAVGTTPVNYATGTRDYAINGLNVAQDAAEADKAFDDADTIGQAQFGGHLIVTNLAQSATYSLAADGKADAVSAMAYATAALVDTALDTLVDRLPSVFCPIAKIVVTNNIAGAFTYVTDDINGTDGAAVFTDMTAGVVDRTVASGFGSHQRNVPAIPATITAPLVGTITSPKPASGPDTLGTGKPASGPDTLTAPAVTEQVLKSR